MDNICVYNRDTKVTKSVNIQRSYDCYKLHVSWSTISLHQQKTWLRPIGVERRLVNLISLMLSMIDDGDGLGCPNGNRTHMKWFCIRSMPYNFCFWTYICYLLLACIQIVNVMYVWVYWHSFNNILCCKAYKYKA